MDTRSFIQSQIRILDTPVRLDAFNESLEQGEEAIPQSTLLKSSKSVNSRIKDHNRAVYPIEATSTLADQIEAAWFANIANASVSAAGDELPASYDVLDDGVLNSLPVEWETDRPSRESDLETFAESQQYSQLREKLVKLKHSKAEKEATVGLLEELLSRLAALEKPLDNIQPGLGTREGELVEEISRMKMLLARSSQKLS